MKRTIFTKILSGYLVIIFSLCSLILIFSFNTIKSHYIQLLEQDLTRLALSVKVTIAPMLEEKKYNDIDALIKTTGPELNTRITIILSDGTVVADSEKDPHTMENHKARPEIIEASNGNPGSSLRFSATINEEMLYLALPLKKGNEIEGYVRLSLHLKDINPLLTKLEISIAGIAAVILIISVIGAVFLARNLARPIKDLSAASKKFAEGDFDVRVFLNNKDEMRDLADNFNYMTGEIRNLFGELSSQKDELHGIISSFQAGVILIDKSGTIILCNEKAKQIAGNEMISGKSFWEGLRNPDFNEIVDNVRMNRINKEGEIEICSRIYHCSASYIPAKDEIIVLLHDITELKNIEKVKKDFVVNVSHELRTPLTAIKGYVETIEDEIDDKNRNYIEIIKRNTDRLVNIVNDLLLLSELEEKGTRLTIEKVNLKGIIENSIKALEHKAREKNIEMKVEADEKVPLVRGDPFKLEQLFINLIDNAIKYTDQGKVTVTLRCEASNVIAKVTDTGIGIPKEDLSRVFERFYVVDKSRSKKSGGTGLGLSIVKHIVMLHNGRIDIESTPGEGSKFTVTLPC
ncbi:MAG: HAMP domain-containing protein [Candidatus Schekmanbacteria bacterium]|nr:HAMP domain-containing protein [Candidatus Schekmanbacteria bacterium]